MYCDSSKKTLANTTMKIVVLFLVLVLICSSVWANVTFVDYWVVGGPMNTPWGEVAGNIMDGELEAGTYRILLDYRNGDVIDSSTPIYNEISYDIDGDSSTPQSYTGSEVGLCYAEAYADVSQEDISKVPNNYAQASSGADGYAVFYIDGDSLSLQWEYEPYEFATEWALYQWVIRIYEQYDGSYVFYADSILGDLNSGNEQISLVPDKYYVLNWSVNSEGINDYTSGFDKKNWGRLTLNIEDNVSEPDIDVSPTSHDFEVVEVGSTKTTTVTISNVGDADLAINSLTFSSGSSSIFSVTSPSSLPTITPPGGMLDVEIVFAPSSEGSSSDVLEIGSDDPDEPSVQVSLSGMGIIFDVPPLEQVVEILAYFDECAFDGDLVGEGDGNSADNRLNALRNMLEEAARLIEGGFYAEACEQLKDAYEKCDGYPKPPDFASGPATEVLAGMILDAIENLGCEYF
jgi:hypothetical protein